MAGRERRQSEREREKGKGETIKDEGDETRRNMTQVMYRKTGSLDRRERRDKGKKGMPPRVNLAYTGVAKHKFPFGDLCLSGQLLLPSLNASVLDTTYLPGPHSRTNMPLLLF